ncbi:TetR family transcriptional regulator [Roseivirga pacifica]|uniref:Transcriptional regulator, TetR family n=1 Tax=Roseivirga pacifica TaxID=1267423 RepID=A0A1I0RJK5_9BACT|nr:TetR/AcrR family transcriptional regulator [Roseivirga pacifica]MCO6357813.1 TetR family transcriptional regulator [Roseivirga pacifica]MCO6366065.1 TetR family transcriptional regulator [Roseivirga pacifica]MCO6371393.1 TetR family transcriptional regulator [Roseivirga pacifica]MCO6375435.1 TetR family transcriptional regulator [Roseivirga pacifica]MCO6378771.1 TetR family transcriptional regulator [Roseivirga pacifica]
MKGRPVKERLIETASDLFYNKGYNRTGINEILEKSGVAKASMYQHFRSKEEIGVEYLKHMDAEAHKKLGAKINAKPQGPERVMAIIEHVSEFFDSGTFRGCWSLNTIAEISQEDKLMMAEILKQKREMKAFTYRLVVDNLNAREPEVIANQLYLIYESALMEARVFNEKWPIEVAKGMFEKIIQEN